MEANLCQSCSMSLTSDDFIGANTDGNLNHKHCTTVFTKEEAIAGMKEFFALLKRRQAAAGNQEGCCSI